MLSAVELRIERSELAWQALNLYERGETDFADYLIGPCGREEKVEVTFTCDRRAATSALFRIVDA
jgi:predicted nucleic-acid-binding protein